MHMLPVVGSPSVVESADESEPCSVKVASSDSGMTGGISGWLLANMVGQQHMVLFPSPPASIHGTAAP